MFRLVNATSLSALVSGFSLLLAACGGGGGSGNPSPAPPVNPNPPAAAINAQASVPSSVTSGATFTVSVALTASSGSGTASVQLVDTGVAMPQITCGPSQTLSIGGSSASFTCQAPQATLGSSNTHQLQVNVNGAANLASPASVAVANGGTVSVQLTDSSGAPITAVAPGQTINVTFSAATMPTGDGEYTVTAPSGWTLANGAVCSVNAQSASCTLPVTVAASAVNGTNDLTIAAAEGSSALSTTLLPISVQAQTPSGGMTLYLAQNISDTLYANLPSQATTFTYQPVFLFQNTSGGSLTVNSVTANGLTNVQHECNAQVQPGATYAPSAATQACTLPANGLYAVFGDLNNNFTSAPAAATVGTTAISVSLQGTAAGVPAATLVQHDQNVVFVKYVAGHVAVRVVNKNATNPIHVANDYAPVQPDSVCVQKVGTCMVTYDSNNVGTASADPANGKFSDDQLELPASGGVIYLPYQNSGRLYLTRGAGAFVSTDIPSVTGSPAAPPYLLIEPTYVQNLAGAPCPPSGTTCESLTVDQSYVNHVSVLGSFNIMGNISNPSQVPGAATLPAVVSADATHGTTTSLSQQQVFQNVANYFASLGAPWKFDPTAGTPAGQQNYIQEDSAGDITQVLAPVAVYQVPQYNPMASDYYTAYINDIYTYVQSHPVYVQTSLAGDVACILEGTVPASGTNAGDLVFNQYSGTCPAGADVPNGIVFANLSGCDFLGAAGQCPNEPEGLFGYNKTYRSQVGETLAAYQAIGLLPCAGNDPATPMNDANARAYVAKTAQFSNPPCLSGLTAPMWNAYADAFRNYVDVYTYSYGDFLGIDGTVTFSDNGFGSYPILYQNLPVAQPVTVYLH